MTIKENLKKIQRNIEAAAVKSGRRADEITLVAVTKTVDAAMINEAIDAGVKDIGESRIQDALKKYPLVKKGIVWHMIGHLQTNKVKDAVKIFDFIHSVDTVRLAGEISRRAGEANRRLKIFVEANLSGEASKSGFKPEDVESALREMAGYDNIKIIGLMTMAPLAGGPEAARSVFRRLRELKDRLSRAGIKGLTLEHLSMGMSGDYIAAIEEGATFVRIGSALFS